MCQLIEVLPRPTGEATKGPTCWQAAQTSLETMASSPAPQTGARGSLRALPNIISLSRVILAAGFVVVHDVDGRLGIVGIAAVTDFLDGWIARRAQVVSR